MGVLMRGVNMPKNCEECNFKGECRDYWAKIREAYTRPSWCPLVEVADRKTEPQNECTNCGCTDDCTECHEEAKWCKDEPQIDAEEVAKDINRRVEMVKKEWNARHIEDEPQTDCSWK